MASDHSAASKGAAPDHRQRYHFGLLILGQVVDEGSQLQFGRIVAIVLDGINHAVVGRVRSFIGIAVRDQRLIFAGALNDAADGFDSDGQFHGGAFR